MSRLAYSNRKAFDAAIIFLEESKNMYLSDIDTNTNLDKYDRKEILLVLNDLKKRKYTFRFKGKIPINHITFVAELEEYLTTDLHTKRD